MEVSSENIRHIIRDKYGGDQSADITGDFERLCKGEPLAYIIGWIPFLGLHIGLDTHPLIPRPETETLIGSVESMKQAQRLSCLGKLARLGKAAS